MTKSASTLWLELLLTNDALRERVRKQLASRTSKPAAEQGCWIFIGCTLPGGYGTINVTRVLLNDGRYANGGLAHRVAYVLANMVIPDGHVLHKCDTPACVNPEHLFVGTAADNMRDKKAKGRATPPPHYLGEAHARHKFTAEQARAVIAMTSAGKKHGTICADLGVTANFVNHVRSGRTWGHITGRVYAPKRHSS